MENKPFVQLCAKMEGVAERAVSIFVDVSPGSAQSKWINDPNTTTVQLQILPYWKFTLFNSSEGSEYNHPPLLPLTFEAGSNQECINISIINDNVVENTTSFSVGISSVVEGVSVRIIGGRITVDIVDDG